MELKQRQAILYEIRAGQVASVADCLLVRYVHSGMHELQLFVHSAIESVNPKGCKRDRDT